MGKSSKKSNAQVAVASPVPTFEKSGKKGKRNAEVDIDNQSAKKQKKEAEEALLGGKKAKKATPAPPPKKKPVSSSSSEEESSDEEIVKQPVAPAKKPALPVKKQDSSSSEEESSSDEEPASKPAAPAKKVVPQKKQESSTSEEDSSSEEEPAKKPAPPAQKSAPLKKTQQSSSSEEESSSDEEPAKMPAQIKKSAHTSKQPESSSSEEESDEEPTVPAKKSTSAVAKNGSIAPSSKMEESSEESDSDEEEEKPAVKKVENDDESEDDSSDESDEEPQAKKKKSVSTPANKTEKKEAVDEEESSEESSSGSEDEEPTKTPQKAMDVVMKDVPSANKDVKSPVTQTKALGSKTLFCGNLPYNADKDSVMEFFQEAGEIVDVRLSYFDDGNPKGFGHVEFATEEGAAKALEMNGQEFMGRALKLDFAKERGAQTPYNERENNSFQKGARTQGFTVFVKGFDKFQEEEQIRSSLENLFKDCGEITRISLPKDYESGSFKGICYMDFKDKDAFNKALELNGQYIGDYSVVVDEAKPRVDSGGGGYSGGRGSGGYSGGRGDRGRSGGRRGGRDGGFGGRRGGGRDGRGRGGRGGRPSMGTQGTGKKTTFWDD